MNKRLSTIPAIVLLFVAALLSPGCEDSEPTAKSTWVIEVSANPATVNTNPNQPVQAEITAVLFDENGRLQPGIGLRFQPDAGSMASGGAVIETDARGEAKDTLTLRDNDLAQGDADVKIRVKSGSAEGEVTIPVGELTAPTASFSVSPPSPTGPGTNLLFSGSLSEDLDGEIDLYTWTIVSDNPDPDKENPWVFSSAGSGFNTSFQNPQHLDITLTVTDNDGLTDSSSDFYEVLENLPPVADAGPNLDGTAVSPTVPQCSVTLNGCSSRDPDGDIVAYKWTFATSSEIRFGSCTLNRSFTARDQAYSVELEVFDNGNRSAGVCANPQSNEELDDCPSRLTDKDTTTVTCRPFPTGKKAEKKK